MAGLRDIVAGLISPVTEIVKKRQDRKIAQDSAVAKLQMKALDSSTQIEFNDQEWERISAAQKQNSWTDEYATVSILSILNIIVFGGIMAAFGEPRVMMGIGMAVQALQASEVNIGLLMETVVFAAVGIHVLRKFGI